MELSKQVCSLELAKRLKELGIKQESLYWCCKFYGDVGPVWLLVRQDVLDEYPEEHETASAFTVAELGNILPAKIYLPENELVIKEREKMGMTEPEDKLKPAWLGIEKTEDDTWVVNYGEDGDIYLEQEADTLSNTMAKMLIYLKENKLI